MRERSDLSARRTGLIIELHKSKVSTLEAGAAQAGAGM
jgi:hypothetical protein